MKIHSIKKKRKNRLKRNTNPYAIINWEKAKDLFKQSARSPNENKSFPSTKQILHILAAAGTIGLTFAFPKAGITIASLLFGDDSYGNWKTNQVISRLQKQKYIRIEYNSDGTTTVKITENGLVRALTYQLDAMTLTKQRKWDKKWRVVIFDIPNKYKRIRDIFRIRLQQLSLYQLQESVYVCPYPCFDEIEFLRELYGIVFKVQYLLVEKIEDDEFLRDRFELN